MINFIEGKINLGDRKLSVDCDYEDLRTLADEGFIERRQTSAGRHYYYVEAAEGSMRFAVFVRLKEKRIEWLLLRWLDRPMKGWDDVSEKAMTDEYRKISNFVKEHVKTPPDNKKTGTRTWQLKWGTLDVSYEVRSFDVAIYMKPKFKCQTKKAM